jgi:hypothetical protein
MGVAYTIGVPVSLQSSTARSAAIRPAPAETVAAGIAGSQPAVVETAGVSIFKEDSRQLASVLSLKIQEVEEEAFASMRVARL